MTEYFGFSRQMFKERGVKLVSDEIIEKTRKKVESIFGNANKDSSFHTEERAGKIQESFLEYRVVIKSLTARMVYELGMKENTGIFIEAIHGTGSRDNGSKIELSVRIHRFWAEPKPDFVKRMEAV